MLRQHIWINLTCAPCHFAQYFRCGDIYLNTLPIDPLADCYVTQLEKCPSNLQAQLVTSGKPIVTGLEEGICTILNSGRLVAAGSSLPLMLAVLSDSQVTSCLPKEGCHGLYNASNVRFVDCGCTHL